MYVPLHANVGIVVIGRNEGDRLIRCLRSINPQNITTVYVDSHSTDGSIAAAERLGAKPVALDVAQPFTAARARNEGFASLKSLRPDIQFVQFLDGDCELDSRWLTTGLAFFAQHEKIAIVCGRRREQHPEASVYNWLCDVEWNTPTGATFTCGGDSLVRVEAFEAVGGFQSGIVAGEEPEFCQRLRQVGWNIWRLDEEMTRHDAAMKHFGQWWRRAVRSGYGYAQALQLRAGAPAFIWRREFTRAIIFGGFVPLGILLGSMVNSIALMAALVYPLQICKIALTQGGTTKRPWAYALFMTASKFAEFQGILKFLWSRLRGQTVALIEYKRTNSSI